MSQLWLSVKFDVIESVGRRVAWFSPHISEHLTHLKRERIIEHFTSILMVVLTEFWSTGHLSDDRELL